MPIQSVNPPDIITLNEWKGLNQQSKRGSIDDEEEFWNENFFAIGPGNLRTCWGRGPVIYTAPSGLQILRIFFGTYGNQTPQYAAPPPGAMGWMFLSDGTVDEVDLNLGTTTGLRAAGGIWSGVDVAYYWASAKVWRPQFFGSTLGQQGGVLFGSPAGLYAWDGTILSRPGDPAPDWLTDLQETDPGATPPPMPSGLPSIYAMEVYQSRLWVAGKDVISFSAPSNGADFSTINGGGSFGYFGDRLVYSYMDLCQSSGFLYCYGDSSTDMIWNLSLTGSGTVEAPFTTNFIYSNVDPQVGQRFPRPIGRIGRYMATFNKAGVFLMEGGEGRPIGDKISGIWNTLDVSSYLPTFAPATMFGFRVLLINGRFVDPWGVTRNLILMWHPTRGHEFWSVASQGVELTNIGSYEQDSSMIPYGTDGTHLYQLFAQPDPSLIKRLSTKKLRGKDAAQLAIKNSKRIYIEVDDNDGRGVQMTGSVISGGGGVPGGTQAVAFELAPGAISGIIPSPIEGAGIWAAIDLQSNSPDFTLERIHLSAEERTLFGA
ncbi:MAG TPA: hypothetical protein VGG68_11515 [Caulobacteraceae bacterium]|jgi:hypothetical protein